MQECIETIKDLQLQCPLKFVWVKAHCLGNDGNDMADRLAKEGAKQPRPEKGPGPFHTVPHSFVRKTVFQWALDKWQHNWTMKQPARQTKIISPEIDLKRGKQVAE